MSQYFFLNEIISKLVYLYVFFLFRAMRKTKEREPIFSKLKIQNSYYLRHKAMLMSSYLTYNPTDYLALLLIQLVTLDLK